MSPFALALLADPISPDLTSLVQYGVLGLVVILLISGVLVPRWVVTEQKNEIAAWRGAYEKERDSHGVTRDANTELSRTANAAVETARTANALLDKLDHPKAPRGARA